MAEFVEFKKSAIWEHFLREKNGKSAQCKLCPAILKTQWQCWADEEIFVGI